MKVNEFTDQIKALAKVTYLPGSPDKRYVGSLQSWLEYKPDQELTEKQVEYIHRLIHRYRRQIPQSHEKLCTICNQKG